MDWYSWLSKSGLEPSLAYDYSLLFTHNELEEEDIPHFDHEFLLSMGISIAKHRLEILKLANKSKTSRSAPRPVARLMSAITRTKKCLARYFSSFPLARVDRSAIVVVPKPIGIGARWKGGMLKREKRLVRVKQGRLMITDANGGGGVKVRDRTPTPYASPMALAGGEEEIRWDSMFQDLKPT